MKIIVYNCRRDELKFLKDLKNSTDAELVLTPDLPTVENAKLAAGCECISILTTPMTAEHLKAYYDAGVRYVSTRSIGYDHIDLKAAESLGMHVGNVSYPPDSVADYTVMLLLMVLRRMKVILSRSAVQDYSLRSVCGDVLPELTIGVIGTGRIGNAVLKRLSGFGCRLLAYAPHRSSVAEKYAEYVPMDQLLADSDVIDLHMPANDQNYHSINRETIARMKDGVYLINTARGSLIDTGDLIDAIESGKIGGAALDVVEQETGLYYNDRKGDVLGNRNLALLRSYPNVLVTPHTAFYTAQAVGDMVRNSVKSCLLFANGEKNPWQVL